MSKTIGIIGLGSIGMRHAKNLIAMGHKVHGHDPGNGKAMDALNVAGGIASSSDEFNNMDGIIIASPTAMHMKHAEEFWPRYRYGKAKNAAIFIEKPIYHRWPDMLGGESLNSPDMVGYNMRFHNCVIRADTMLAEGRIGTPYAAHFIVAQKNSRPSYLRDGVILNWSHEIDLALHLLGPAKVIASATRLTDGKDDLTDIILLHDSGCRSHIHLDYLGDPEIRDFYIQGDKGNLFANLIKPRFITTRDSKGEQTEHLGDTFDQNYVTEMKAFIDCIDGKPHLGCTGAEALEVLKICLEVRKQAGL